MNEDADFVRVFSFVFSKAFDTIPRDVVCNKLKALDINPYTTNWIIKYFECSCMLKQTVILLILNNTESWALNNRMTLNLTKTKEVVVRGRTSKPIPSQIR